MFENIKQEEGFKIKKLLILPEKKFLYKNIFADLNTVVISGIANPYQRVKKSFIKTQ